MKCPICQLDMSAKHESSGHSWFSGTYRCTRHGIMRVSGRVFDDGERRVTHWLPSCQEHGFVAVTQTNHDRYLCLACSEEIRVVKGNLVHIRPVQLIGGRRALALM
jgi:hypothetical protein